jgi:hypothetical protein
MLSSSALGVGVQLCRRLRLIILSSRVEPPLGMKSILPVPVERKRVSTVVVPTVIFYFSSYKCDFPFGNASPICS